MGAYKERAEERQDDNGLGEFLQYLIESEQLTDRKEIGIATAAAEKGIDGLYRKQKYVLKGILEQYEGETCDYCEEELTWGEMVYGFHDDCNQRAGAFAD